MKRRKVKRMPTMKRKLLLSKVDKKGKFKGKDRSKDKDDKGKKKETRTCNHCGMKGHIEVNCWKKNPSLMPEKFKGKKTEKAGAAVEEEHLLSLVDIDEAYLSATIISTDYGFGNVTDKDDIPDLEDPTECEDKEKVSELKTSCTSEA